MLKPASIAGFFKLSVELSMPSSNFFDWAAPDEAHREMKKPTFAKASVGGVGRTGFEPATPWSQTTYSTGLNYLPLQWECKYKGLRLI